MAISWTVDCGFRQPIYDTEYVYIEGENGTPEKIKLFENPIGELAQDGDHKKNKNRYKPPTTTQIKQKH